MREEQGEQEEESAYFRLIPGRCLRTITAKIDQRRNAAGETELIWRRGRGGGKKGSESEADRKRKESPRHEERGVCNQRVNKTLPSPFVDSSYVSVNIIPSRSQPTLSLVYARSPLSPFVPG